MLVRMRRPFFIVSREGYLYRAEPLATDPAMAGLPCHDFSIYRNEHNGRCTDPLRPERSRLVDSKTTGGRRQRSETVANAFVEAPASDT
jgi:hypothetical protein